MAQKKDPNAVFAGRVPPQNLEAERSVLGAMLLDVDAYHDMLHLLIAEYFYSPANRKVFEALQKLAPNGKPADMVIVAEEMKNSGDLGSIGGLSYLAELTTEVPSIQHVAHYGNIVKEQFQLRELARASLLISDKVFAGSSAGEAYEFAESNLSKLSDLRLKQGQDTFVDMLQTALGDFDNRLQGKYDDAGLTTPWPSFHQFVHSFRAGEMIVIAARPAMGKTSFALNLVLDIAIQQKSPVLFFSLEMTALNITNNLLCIDAEIDGTKWRKPSEAITEKEQSRIMNSVERLSKAPIFIDDDSNLKPNSLRAKARRMKRDIGLGAIVIDYLQLMKDDYGNISSSDGRTQEMSSISRQLKAISKEFEIPIFALAQLNRGVEARSDHTPRMSDLRESGSIEQDADVVILLNRPEYYSPDPNNVLRPGEADVIVAKNRHGDVGKAEMLFIKKQMTFTEKDRLN